MQLLNLENENIYIFIDSEFLMREKVVELFLLAKHVRNKKFIAPRNTHCLMFPIMFFVSVNVFSGDVFGAPSPLS